VEYAEYDASPALRPYIRCFWTLSAPAGGGTERVLPDGCPEIILNRADPFVGRGDNGARRVQPLTMAVGQLGRYLEIEPSGQVDLLGIRFEPAGMHALLGVPMCELTGERVALDRIDRRFHRRLLDASRIGRRAIESILLDGIDRTPSRATLAAARLAAERGSVPLGELGLPARTLERHFRAEIGLSPKRLARILRFHRVVSTLDRGRPPDWALLALDAGYFDQAHLIRDFREFAGITPGAYLREQYALADLLAGVSDSSTR
jgi:AraC-like DNA-binding protein